MKVRFYRWYNALLTALLSMLGFESCEPVDEYGAPPDVLVMYGTPTISYVVKGVVTDEAGTPIPGVKTTLKELVDKQPEYAYTKDSVLTDAAGTYLVKGYSTGSMNWQKLVVDDIDGEANGGAFQSDTIDLSQLEGKKVGNGNGEWIIGNYEYTVDIKLKKK